MNIGAVGKSGEDRVAAFLIKRGYKVISRNYQCRFGEIDIIAEHNEYIVFVEVKTRKKDSLVAPAEAVNFKKRERIMLTAQDFISKTSCERQPRFDVAEVTVDEKADKSPKYHLNYIKNAF